MVARRLPRRQIGGAPNGARSRRDLRRAARDVRETPRWIGILPLWKFATTLLIAAPVPLSAQPAARECDTPAAAWIWCDDFESDRTASYFEYKDADGAFVRAAETGISGSFGMRARFAPRQVDAGALHLAIGRTPQPYMRAVGPATRFTEVYWRFFLRTGPGWKGGGGEKLTRAMVFGSSVGFAQAMIAHVWSGRSGTPEADHLELDPARGTDGTGSLRTQRYNDAPNLRWLGRIQSESRVMADDRAGRWQCIEIRVRLNDPGATNGDFRLWVDGTEQAGRAGLDWVGTYREYGINAIYLENYWNAGSPTAQDRFFDNFVVSRERIGC